MKAKSVHIYHLPLLICRTQLRLNCRYIHPANKFRMRYETWAKKGICKAFPAPSKPFGFWSQTTSQVDLTADLVMGLRRILEGHNWRNSPIPWNAHTVGQVLQCRDKSKTHKQRHSLPDDISDMSTLKWPATLCLRFLARNTRNLRY